MLDFIIILMVNNMHSITFNNNLVRTDLIIENKPKGLKTKKIVKNGYTVMRSLDNNYSYSTIYFNDITDYDLSMSLRKILIDELKRFIKINKNDVILVVGLGNMNSTPDSLGPRVINHVLVTRYLYLLDNVDNRYTNVSIFRPDVLGNTGIESLKLIKKVVEEVKPTKVIVIDALKTNHVERLMHTIQITNRGIFPGSGINNYQGELSKDILNCDVVAIGVPTIINYSKDLMVTPTNIDYIIDKLSVIIGNSLNNIFHKDYLRQ